MAVFLAGYASKSLAGSSELRELLLACSKIENNEKRLDCVDTLIRSIANQAIVETMEPQNPQEPIPEKTSISDSSDSELGKKYLPETQEITTQTSLRYNLIAVYKDHKKRWIFEFDNGQVWQQVEPRYLPKLKDLPVRVDISEGVFGSHDLRAEEFAAPVKVKRII
jgi:hypothetical protein